MNKFTGDREGGMQKGRVKIGKLQYFDIW